MMCGKEGINLSLKSAAKNLGSKGGKANTIAQKAARAANAAKAREALQIKRKSSDSK